MKAPFPWFGGKSRAASLVWERFGDVPNYVEPFAGSLAVLLARPTAPRVETVNDLDAYLANFWRAVQADPEAVAAAADWPVNETDLHARHAWLVNDGRRLVERLLEDPTFYDARIAGWWVWGICQWIGSGWCVNPEWTGRTNAGRRARGLARQLPDLSGDSGAVGRGVHASAVDTSRGGVASWLRALADRLRRVRVACGDWKRILGPAPTTCIGVTGVLLDPPYADTAGRDAQIYAQDSLTVAHDVRAWALANGDNAMLRIALCGYDGEHDMPETWECVAWKAHGGYGAQGSGKGRTNSARERIWFSPACLRPQRGLFDGLGALG